MTGTASPANGAGTSLADLECLSPALAAEWLEQYGVLPMHYADGTLALAAWQETIDPLVLDDLRLHFGAGRVTLALYPEQEVRAAIRRLHGNEVVTAQSLISGMSTTDTRARDDAEIPLDDLLHLANEAPVVRLVNLLLLEALEARASDVHLEGYADGMRVRYRIDGVLQEAPSPPRHLMPAIISRLKVMAELDIAERRLPQDGRIRLTLQNRQVDVRVSTLPTLRGESVVLRLLDRERGRIGLTELGMADDTMALFREAIAHPHGIVLATGPTGSGKTTTLYAAVDLVKTGREKILTVEDPVEYQLSGVPQVPVNEKAGVTFATALRALLRQDPDVMLVGEIRDAETAEIATQAALTGHLVLSTLHTNDAATALTRLIDLEVAPYLVASTVNAVLAQRLVRTICRNCAERVPIDASVVRGSHAEELGVDEVWEGRGARSAGAWVTAVRRGIYELLVVDDELRTEVQRHRGSHELRAMAIANGMRTLQGDGFRLVRAGVTTVAEVLRVART